MNLYFIHTLKIGNKIYIRKRGCGFNENGWLIERTGWKVQIKRLRQTDAN